MSRKQPVVICADDYGISPGVNSAILELATSQRVSAVSCLVTYPDWQVSAAQLRDVLSKVQVGLHFHFGRGSIDEQLQLFIQKIGRWPDFIDGHQHLHQLPWLSRQLIRVLKSAPAPIYTRQTSLPSRLVSVTEPKTLAINFLGRRWYKMALANKIAVNDYFAGVYDLKVSSFAETLNRFKETARSIRGNKPIFMVHPGRVDAILKSRDSLQATREVEYAVLASKEWAEFMNQEGFLQFV